MIFPCMELFLVIFQVSHDFQSLWEPCWYIDNIHSDEMLNSSVYALISNIKTIIR